MTRKYVEVAMALVVSLAFAGCDGGKSGVSPRPRATTGMRGVVLRELSCTSKPKSPGAGVVAIGTVQEFRLCRSGLRGVPLPPLIVTANERQFELLSTALSAPNAPPTTAACPALSEAEIVLLAKTSAGAFRVSIPVDGCGLYQQGAVDAVYGASPKSAS